MTAMHSHTLTLENRAELAAALAGERWIVACLCAAWCGTCTSYRATFETLAARHPQELFIWIDIEDRADMVGDLDVENFPTLLMQHGDVVAFFGTMLPELALAERLLQAQMALAPAELARQSGSTEQRREWQEHCNLRMLLGTVAG